MAAIDRIFARFRDDKSPTAEHRFVGNVPQRGTETAGPSRSFMSARKAAGSGRRVSGAGAINDAKSPQFVDASLGQAQKLAQHLRRVLP
jgi:hypothetical protein